MVSIKKKSRMSILLLHETSHGVCVHNLPMGLWRGAYMFPFCSTTMDVMDAFMQRAGDRQGPCFKSGYVSILIRVRTIKMAASIMAATIAVVTTSPTYLKLWCVEIMVVTLKGFIDLIYLFNSFNYIIVWFIAIVFPP
jgi:hypothetical protein